ncbi:PglL family O-oligosaccharyltransferase [Cupriavidus taiwanensis]|uniref:PglL family O-oligosaccharyltransferase n=1 Tax=Cupriavidus taiwanensis TaxID=164546 RepID=UPI000E102E59|nr:O-antigen ligase family protein [Cupriavidus taiwanensis]SOY54625.1 putative Polymerase [Cupriavidus taiwanensis]SOY55313.1 putative Polymerase [Cupriavidus taiwanensis]SOY89440.1 putative Polymerase [Cupriavidus taiwanensis]SOZ61622.1 putative Polymerase [Cupriavidus taiwanensis]SOZ81705.1 putative Polymerase [Cupriavidus taiwanensis]
MRAALNKSTLWSALLLTFIFWSAPFLVVPHTFPIPTFYSEFFAIATSTFLVGVALLMRTSQRGQLPIAMVASAPIGLILALLVQLAVMRVSRPVPSFLAIFFCLCAILSIHAGLWLGCDPNRTKRLLRAGAVGSVLCGLISCGMAWAQAFGLEAHYSPWVATYPYDSGRRLFANLYQPNHLGSVIALAIAGALYLRRTYEIGRFALMVVLIALAIGIALTASRTPVIQTAVLAAAALIMARVQERYSPIKWWRAALFGALPLFALLAAMLLMAWLNQTFDLRLATSAAERMSEQGQISPRLALWRYALEVFGQNPWFGVGWGEYVRAQYLIAHRLGPVEMGNNAHNIVLDLLAKTGLVGAAATLLPCLYWYWCSIKAIRAGDLALQRTYCVTVVSVVAVHAMLEFPQNHAFFLLPVCFVMGLAETRYWQCMSRGLSIGLAVAMLVAVSAGLVTGYYDYRKAEVVYEQKGVLRYFVNPAFIFADWARYGLTGGMELDRELLSEKLAMHENALTISATPDMIRRYTVLLALDNRPREALLQVQRIRNLSNGQFDAQYARLIGMCNEQKGEIDEFKGELLKLYGQPNADKGGGSQALSVDGNMRGGDSRR